MHTATHTHVHAHDTATCTHTCMHTTQPCPHTCAHAHLHTATRAHTQPHAHTYACACTPHSHVHTQPHALTCMHRHTAQPRALCTCVHMQYTVTCTCVHTPQLHSPRNSLLAMISSFASPSSLTLSPKNKPPPETWKSLWEPRLLAELAECWASG